MREVHILYSVGWVQQSGEIVCLEDFYKVLSHEKYLSLLGGSLVVEYVYQVGIELSACAYRISFLRNSPGKNSRHVNQPPS